MAPLAPSNTARFRFHYESMDNNHTIQFRSTASPAAQGVFVADFLTNLSAAIVGATITFVEWAPAGSDIFNIVVTGIEGTTYGTSPEQPEFAAWQLVFVGRTAGGRRVRAGVFGVNSLGTNYRFTPGESTVVTNAIGVLQANTGLAQGIDGLAPVWKNYANVKPNDHWVKVLR